MSYESKIAALQRELDAIRSGALLSTKGSTLHEPNTHQWLESLPSWPPPTPPAPEPVDRERERMRKRVEDYEATLVRKLIARTPAGPEGAGVRLQLSIHKLPLSYLSVTSQLPLSYLQVTSQLPEDL